MLRCILLLGILLFVSGCCNGSICKLNLPSVSSIAEASDGYDAVRFEKPQSQEALAYLGLTGEKKTFTLEEIETPVLLVEVFSVSCPYCQRAAKHFEALHELIAQKGLSQKIKIIGIGMESSSFEVEIYRKKFGIRFPLVADPGNQAYRIVGRVEIPYFLVLRRDANSKFAAVYSKSRGMRKSKDIFDTILNATGLFAQEK